MCRWGRPWGQFATPRKAASNTSRTKMAQRDDQILEDAIGPEAFALLQLALIFFVDLLLGFVVHGGS